MNIIKRIPFKAWCLVTLVFFASLYWFYPPNRYETVLWDTQETKTGHGPGAVGTFIRLDRKTGEYCVTSIYLQETASYVIRPEELMKED